MGLFIWLLIGGLIGWAAAFLRRIKLTAQKVECILTGVTGGVIGGLLTNVFYPPGGIHIDFTWQTAITAVLGAIIVLVVYLFIFDRRTNF